MSVQPVAPGAPINEGQCYRHPERHTVLTCSRCGRAICTQCARSTEVGYRCPDCLYELQTRHHPDGIYLDPLAAPETKPVLTYVILVALVAMWGLQEYLGGSTDNDTLIEVGSTYGERILQGEIWRLFSAMFLHIGAMHLLFNSMSLLSLGRIVESRYGYLRFAVIYFAAGYFGNLLSFALRGPFEFSAGASGAIFGLLGAELGFLLYHRRQLGDTGRAERRHIFKSIAFNLVIGVFYFSINNVAHIGGLVAGVALGYLLAPRYRPSVGDDGQNRYIDLASLRRLWWVPALAAVVLAGSTSGTLFAWNNYRQDMEAFALRLSLLPFEGLIGLMNGFGSEDEAFYGEEYEEPVTIKLDAVTECYDYTVEGASFVSCSGYLEDIGPHHEYAVDLAPLPGDGPYHVDLNFYMAEGLEEIIEVTIPEATGAATVLRAHTAAGSYASGYMGIVQNQFTVVFDASGGEQRDLEFNLSVVPVDE